MIVQNSTATRQAIIEASRESNRNGLNQGTSGNISVRTDEGVVITPTSRAYETMKPEDLALLPLGGAYGAYTGPYKPSSEWRFHSDIYAARSDVNAIVHVHATYATVLSMLRKDIPACHYMIAAFGGPTIRCADYAIFGSKELSDAVVKALEGRLGCIMGTHGMIAVGKTLDHAMWLAVELENLAKQYYLALQIGEPVILADEEIARVDERMKHGYGIWG
ncbi:MAG: class II aldolase/adducin family protein [Alphaproteobacteria bacterium]|nr:class II aldolase/adducin family protein [Alphaproteobacteria bacterium]